MTTCERHVKERVGQVKRRETQGKGRERKGNACKRKGNACEKKKPSTRREIMRFHVQNAHKTVPEHHDHSFDNSGSSSNLSSDLRMWMLGAPRAS